MRSYNSPDNIASHYGTLRLWINSVAAGFELVEKKLCATFFRKYEVLERVLN